MRALAEALGLESPLAGVPDVSVTGVTMSSQRVRPGDLYAAVRGARAHGVDFAAEAVAAGARAILTDPEGLQRASGLGVPVLVAAAPRGLVGTLAALVYAGPARHLTLIGVTGTQGKTTTTRLLEGAVQRASGHAAVIGTIGTRIDGHDVPTRLTTPEAADLHGLFARMVEDGVTTCAMEVSSHALVMGRVDGVRFDVAVFLNLGRDHLDFHHDVEDYFAAKAMLFTPERAARGLVNLDDEHGRRLFAAQPVPTVGFSLLDERAAWRAVEIEADAGGSTFRVLGPGVDVRAGVPVAGRFNVANGLAALAAAGEAGLDVAVLAEAMAHAPGVPGRLERVTGGVPAESGPTVIVDYAHKPDAVTAVLETLRPVTTGELVIVLGAGGDRDRGKRPVMAEIAARLGDRLVVTDDNPRTEDPAAIRAEMLAGVPADLRARVVEVGDRGQAIRRAVATARAGDVVLIAGKGHETGQEVDGVVHPFDDVDVAGAALRERAAGRGGDPAWNR